MSLAFIIERTNYYRLLGPIIEVALRQGREVECWHCYDLPSKPGEFPTVESVPRFRSGTPTVRPYEGAQLQNWLLGRRVDSVVALATPRRILGDRADGIRPQWATVQEWVDYFAVNGPEGILSGEVGALASNWWLGWGSEYFLKCGLISDAESYRRSMALRSVAVGLPEVDQLRYIDPAEVRKRWGIPPDQPVVVLLPFGAASSSFWRRRIFLEPSFSRRLAWILARRRFEYLSHLRHGRNDVSVVRALRAFCDRNGAYLLVKSRRKTPIPDYLSAIADRCLYDESAYPATSLECLSIANLCVSFYSSVVFEAAALRVPSLCVTFSAYDLGDGDAAETRRLDFYLNDIEGHWFNFPGISRTMSIPEAIDTLPRRSLAEFAIDEAAAQRYIEQYVGPEDRHSSERVLAALDGVR